MKDKDEQFWRSKLTPEQFEVLRERGTEAPFSGEFLNNKEEGIYTCAACATPLFSSETKFDSKGGWPSFFDVLAGGNVEVNEDTSHGTRLPDGQVKRTEVTCATCGGHLGHLFPDGPTTLSDGRQATGKRYCINSVALNFKEK